MMTSYRAKATAYPTKRQCLRTIQSLQSEYDSISREKSKTATELAYADARVIIRPSQRNLVKSRVEPDLVLLF